MACAQPYFEPTIGASRFGLSQMEWIPEYYDRTPYHEDEIVGLMTELYKLLVELCYITDDDIDWAPMEGHLINEILCEEIGIEEAVVSLMRRLPYHKDNRTYYGFFLFPQSKPYRYVDDDHIRNGRDPETLDPFNYPPRLDFLSAQDLAHASPGLRGTMINLDTREIKDLLLP